MSSYKPQHRAQPAAKVVRAPDGPRRLSTRRAPLDVARSLAPLIAAPTDPHERAAARWSARTSPLHTAEHADRVHARSLPSQLGQALDHGQALPADVRARAEQEHGADLSAVQVHVGDHSATIAEQLNARAFTFGNHIVFGRNEWQPRSSAGNRLLKHELFHSVRGADQIYRAPKGDPNVEAVLDAARAGQDGDALTKVSTATTAAADSDAVISQLQAGLAQLMGNGQNPDTVAAATFVLRRLASEPPGQPLELPPRYVETSAYTSADNRTMVLDMKLGKSSRLDPKKRKGLPTFPMLGEYFFAHFVHHYDALKAASPLLQAQAGDADPLAISTPGQLDALLQMLAAARVSPQGLSAQQAELEKIIGLASFHATADTLNVESAGSERYIAKGGAFKCNIYLTDFVDLHVDDPYLPKQWWQDPEAVKKYHSADEISTVTNPATLMTPPTLNQWLRLWGPKYGWLAVPPGADVDPEQQEKNAQALANEGKLVIFTTKTCIERDPETQECKEPTGGEGHSGVVAPEGSKRYQNFGSGTVGTRFVRSQAGEVQLRQGRVNTTTNEGIGSIFDSGHFGGGFWVYSPKHDDSKGKASVVRKVGK